jgi:hypothetical protein
LKNNWICPALFAIGSDGSAAGKKFPRAKEEEEEEKKSSILNGIEIISKEMFNAFFFFLPEEKPNIRRYQVLHVGLLLPP